MLKRLLMLTLLFFSMPAAHARIYILIDEASNNKFPIAVPNFLTPSGSPSGAGSKYADLLIKDLTIAGIFNVLDESKFPSDDRDVEHIDFSKWKALDAQALVKGVVSGSKLELRLYDVAEQKMILGKQYTVNAKNYADAVHRFTDSLMKELTGTRGPFESKIAASCGRSFKRTIATFEMDGERMGGVKSGLNAISPAFSPDGGSVAFTAFNSRYPEVYINGRQVTKFQSTTITPAWVPGGKGLVLASAKSGDTELYLVSTGGRVLSQITRSPNIDVSPTVSPDGGEVVFASERAGGLHLFRSAIGGGGASRLTYTGYQNDQPDWSPDGSKIIFTSRDQGAFDIFVMEADGSNIQRLTRGEGNNEAPTWSPDSRYVAYASSRGGLMVMLVDGNAQTLIPKSAGCINPDWGPWLTQEE